MIHRKRRPTGHGDRDQLHIEWTAAAPPPAAHPVRRGQPRAPQPAATPSPPVQVLPWDFKASFPEPTDDAIESGVLAEGDREPENLKALHENYSAHCLSTLRALSKVLDARRRRVDPGTGKKPRTHAARERLRKYLAEEPGHLEHTFEVLLGTYADAFGIDAADAFRKALYARHAGIAVTAEGGTCYVAPGVSAGKRERRRASSRLPVPRPLAASVAAGVFGREESGKPVRPEADEVRAITEEQAERMLGMNDAELAAAVTRYAEDFGVGPARQLERHVRRQQRSR